MCAHVKPGNAPPQDFHSELSPLEVFHVEICDFQFTASGRSKRSSQIDDLRVIKIEPRDGIGGLRVRRLFLDMKGSSITVEFHYTVTLRIVDAVCKNSRSFSCCGCALQ